MRKLVRPEMPRILREKQQEWTDKFAASGERRPDPKKYGHAEIKAAAQAMSHFKCAYCERRLAETEGNVEHRLGVSPPKRAFEWENLYWACTDCNYAKKSLDADEIEAAIDPAGTTIDPCDHIEFEDELIESYRGSPAGIHTIRVFGLWKDSHNYRRLKRLTDYRRRREDLRSHHRASDPIWMKAALKILLEEFASIDQPYSAMFVARLRRLDAARATSPAPA